MAGRSTADLIAEFVEAVMSQSRCIERGDARSGNRDAARYIAAARQLLAAGDQAVESFCDLLEHPDEHVRGVAAAFLLKARTARAVATLRPIAQGQGDAAFGAQRTLARYERGDLEIV